jgi:hypothetical protein
MTPSRCQEFNMITYDVDHGLPLIALKEQRRDLIMSLRGLLGPISPNTICEIAAIQTAIAAIEAVIIDIDEELIPSEGEPITLRS